MPLIKSSRSGERPWGLRTSSETDPSGTGHDTPDADLAARRGLRLVLYDALASEAMGTLTTGVFLAGFAVELAAPNFAIGILAAVPFFVQLLQIPAVFSTSSAGFSRAVKHAAGNKSGALLLTLLRLTHAAARMTATAR